VLSGLSAVCVSYGAYDQLNQRLAAEFAQGQVPITSLQGAAQEHAQNRRVERNLAGTGP
jgi:hypothetical protein